MVALLVLDPAFGGTTFGPFPPGTVVLGADGQRSTIVLQGQPGVLPVHCQVVIQPDGRVFVQPTERAAALYLHARGRAAAPLQSAAPLAPGDSFSLGLADGVKFSVVVQAAPAMGQAARVPTGRDRLSAGSLAAEARRQADASLQTVGPLAALRKLGFSARSGALFQPRYVIGALIGLGGLLVTGCGGIAAIVTGLLHR